jgi:endo-1,4-beta-D-glucanase Y
MSGTAITMDSALGAGVRSETWPAWQRFKLLYLGADGRIADGEAHITTSEDQAYALFFALVGNDRSAFDLILGWTHDNLCTGKLDKVLPARQWGRARNGVWRVLDGNAAASADLWLAYSLGEAGRLWNKSRYANLAAQVAANIIQQEVTAIPRLGTVLLPGPQGFVSEHGWRLNPGNLPLSVLRGLARQTRDPQWTQIAQSSERIILGAAPHGIVPDWIEFDRDGLRVDRRTGAIGTYDAMRVYLWAGMLPASDPARDTLLNALKSMLNRVAERGTPPEVVDSQTLEMHGDGSPGFSAALLPMLANAHMTSTLQIQRLRAAEGSLQNDQNHYSDALALFGLGWLEQRYRFNRAGLLNVRWTAAGTRPH